MSDSKPIRVLVLYQNPLVAAGLISALDQQPDVALMPPCSTIPDDHGAGSCEADVVVTDYRRGLQLLARMRVASKLCGACSPRVLILTDRDSECEIRHALQLGAHGYLTLGCGFDELADAVRALHRRMRHIGTVAASRLADSVASEPLTGRELDVLRLLVEGHPNKGIARQLNIAPGTVKSHMKGLFQKLGASSRTQVATVAERRGLLSLAERVSDYPVPRGAEVGPVAARLKVNWHPGHLAAD